MTDHADISRLRTTSLRVKLRRAERLRPAREVSGPGPNQMSAVRGQRSAVSKRARALSRMEEVDTK
jgi:hypothetical protein